MKAAKTKSITYAYRRNFVLVLIALGFAVLAVRAYNLQIQRSDFLSLQGEARHQRVLSVSAHRGMITDRHGEPLAISTPVQSVCVNPGEFTHDPVVVAQLAAKMQMDPKALKHKVAKAAGREFVYIKRRVPPPLADEVLALRVPGVFLQREYKRYYPTAEVTAHLLGFTDIDDRGQEGIELAYNHWLEGQPGAKRVMRDRLGHVIQNIENIKTAKPGRHLSLSIDKRLQYLAYRELKKTVQQHKAESGSVVILDSQSGEVLAMVNQPSFNPNNRKGLHGKYFRNRAVTDVFEPGSTMKPFTIAAALENDYVKPTQKIDTAPGFINVASYKIKDAKNYGVLDLEGIIHYSSNVGATKLALSLPASDLWHTYSRFGFGISTDSGFPGESAGFMHHFDKWGQAEQATMSYGYGLSATALQLAYAYNIVANDGIAKPVSLQKVSELPTGVRVLSSETAAELRKMLISVVNGGGTGKRAQVPGFVVAGKTGTALKSASGGYAENKYTSVFAGMAPAANPALVTIVVINNPDAEKGQYHGGQLAAPLFAGIMEDALRLLNIPPDDIDSLYADFDAQSAEGSI